ncbi:MAG: hypothetical protein K6A14_06405 [Erysipelotrichaceae bacterium]|nr:hypothetical protein [Erysipelotrichaceae bacterium]
MKRKGLLVLIVATAAVLCAAAVLKYWTDYRRTPVVSFTEGSREVKVYQIGDPQFPFGQTRGRLVLINDGRKVTSADFEVSDDGAVLQPQNFRADWKAECVEITVYGSEQEPETITLEFD